MKNKFANWLKISLWSLALLATAGFLLRIKMAFPLPFIDQRNLLHGHSHFAFAGWVSQVLMVLISRNFLNESKPLNRILAANILTAYGMFFSFAAQGYQTISLFFSTASIIIAAWFSIEIFKRIKGNKWIVAALFFCNLSAFGTFALAYMMASHSITEKAYLLSVYFYLHFQYNGWFTFALIGILSEKICATTTLNRFFTPLFLVCFPTYFLSAMWLDVPKWTYFIFVGAAILQLWAMIQIYSIFQKNRKRLNQYRWLISFSLFAGILKTVLQALSTIPQLNTYVFGFRPIVIGYLHLVLLGFITLGLLGFALQTINCRPIWLKVFVSGVLLNEVLLMLQGLAALGYESIPYIQELLIIATSILMTGSIGIAASTSKKQHQAPLPQ